MAADIPPEAQPGYVESELEAAQNLTDTREFWIKGNHRNRIAEVFLQVHQSERCYWFDVTYVEQFDITRLNVSLSAAMHKVSLSDLLHDHEWAEIDYETMNSDHVVNNDDLQILEQEIGLL